MKILELFSGTKSISKAFPDAEVVSVDTDPTFDPTFVCDIMDFDYTQFDSFDYIHASPPCTEYRILQTSYYGRKRTVNGVLTDFTPAVHEAQLVNSDRLVLRALEIIEHFRPKCWTIENPCVPGWKFSLINREFMKDLNYTICNYCMYNNHGTRKKPTVFFNNFGLELLKCGGGHKHGVWHEVPKSDGLSKLHTRYVIPPLLCAEIADQVGLV